MKKERCLLGCLNQIKLSCRKVFIRHLRIFISAGRVNERKEIRRSRITNFRDDKPLCYNGKAFTLIELLVVVLIIGILAAVAVPQYEKVVERSKATQALTLLKSVGMAAEEHMLASGNEIASFDELSVDIPWPVSARVQGISQDTHSNGEWAIEIEHYTVNGGGSILWMTRLKGKYKGACFIIPLGQGATHNSDLRIKCVERKTGGTHLFSTSLAQGSYCEKIMKGTLNGEDAYSRLYNLP